MELGEPDGRLRESFVAALRELQAEGLHLDLNADDLGEPDAFDAFVEQTRRERLEEVMAPLGLVPSTTLWLMDGDEWLGRVSIRHRLTERLTTYGGHIGYEVKPSRRRQGYGLLLLRKALPLAHGLGVDPALLTCSRTNVASRRIIEACAGVATDPVGERLRFWVPTSS